MIVKPRWGLEFYCSYEPRVRFATLGFAVLPLRGIRSVGGDRRASPICSPSTLFGPL